MPVALATLDELPDGSREHPGRVTDQPARTAKLQTRWTQNNSLRTGGATSHQTQGRRDSEDQARPSSPLGGLEEAWHDRGPDERGRAQRTNWLTQEQPIGSEDRLRKRVFPQTVHPQAACLAGSAYLRRRQRACHAHTVSVNPRVQECPARPRARPTGLAPRPTECH